MITAPYVFGLRPAGRVASHPSLIRWS